ncbi:MAG: peptidase M23, partial [Acidimicrobiia bacterium]
EYTIQKVTNLQRSPAPAADQAPACQFTGPGPSTMSLEIFLDESESSSGNVSDDVQKLFDCCNPTPESLSTTPSPPFVLFGWGSTISFPAVVKSVQAKFTRFAPSGDPTRALCTVQLEQVPSPNPGQNPTSGSVGTRRTHVVVAGESLASIAYREYMNPNLWRPIAEANGIDDPLRVPTGLRLLIPSLDEAEPSA